MIFYLVGTDGQTPVVVIPDSNGHDHKYHLTAEADGVTVTRCDTSEAYKVSRDFALGLTCSCKAFEFRGRYGATDCKHTRAVKALEAVAKALENLGGNGENRNQTEGKTEVSVPRVARSTG